MPQLPILSGREIIKILSKIGYSVARQRGSHIRLTAPDRQPITVPDYKSIDRSLLIKILRDAQLKPDDFLKLID